MSGDPNDKDDSNSAADDIAAEITKILVKAFTSKEGREPTSDEVQMLIEELTEERIESMLSGGLDEEGEDSGGENESDKEGDAVSASADEGEPNDVHGNLLQKENTETQKRNLTVESVDYEHSEDLDGANKSKKTRTEVNEE